MSAWWGAPPLRRSEATAAPDQHPNWICKRGTCDGVLTLLGSARRIPCLDLESAKRRAFAKRQEYPETYVHGAVLTCSRCGESAFKTPPVTRRSRMCPDGRLSLISPTLKLESSCGRDKLIDTFPQQATNQSSKELAAFGKDSAAFAKCRTLRRGSGAYTAGSTPEERGYRWRGEARSTRRTCSTCLSRFRDHRSESAGTCQETLFCFASPPLLNDPI